MKICIPVNEDKGLESPVCDHFGSAPVFLVVDTESRETRAIPNTNAHHAHGMCRPLDVLSGEDLQGIVVRGIGKGAVARVNAAGITAYLSDHATVQNTLDAFLAGTLEPVTPRTACGGHGRGHGCG